MVKYVFGTSFLRALTFMKRRERITHHSPPLFCKVPPRIPPLRGGGGPFPPYRKSESETLWSKDTPPPSMRVREKEDSPI